MASKPKKKSGFGDLLKATQQPQAALAVEKSGRRMKDGYIQVGANIPRQLKIEVFKRLQDDGRSFSNLVEDLLQVWLDEA